jgi:RNA polymerase sigma-70 factor (ECF subfamily)
VTFEQLYIEYKDFIFNLAKKYCTDLTEAEDLCHDILIKINENFEQFKGESKVSTWVYRIAVNHCLNYARRKKIIRWSSFHFASDDDDKQTDFPDHTINIEDDYDKRENQKKIENALSKLPERQRAAFLLNKYEELPYQEIAEILNCSLSSVESLIFRAKQNLTKQLLKLK